MNEIVHFHNHVGTNPEKFYKATLFESPRLLLGLNCLEPGQSQRMHDHPEQDKFYLVLEGEGTVLLGEDAHAVTPGQIIWAAAGRPHGVKNTGNSRLTLLVGIAPAPGS